MQASKRLTIAWSWSAKLLTLTHRLTLGCQNESGSRSRKGRQLKRRPGGEKAEKRGHH